MAVPRINYDLPADLHTRAKVAAARRGQTLRAWVEAALESAVDAQEAEEAERKRRGQ